MSTVLGFVALLIVGGALALWFRAARRVRLPRDRSGYVATWLGGAALGVAALGGGPGWLGGVPAALAVLGGVFFSFTVSISAQKLGADAIQVGDPLPDFAAPDENGEPVSLASLSGQPLLLKFFRGHW